MTPEYKFSAKNLIEIRKAKKISVPKLAELANVSKSYLWRLENTISNPTLEILNRLGDVLGVAFKLESKSETRL